MQRRIWTLAVFTAVATIAFLVTTNTYGDGANGMSRVVAMAALAVGFAVLIASVVRQQKRG